MHVIKNIQDIIHTFYINLEHRVDRKIMVEEQLQLIGLPVNRFNAIKMQNGAVGCSMSHLKCLQLALKNNWDHVFICEDDITFLNPELFKKQLNTFLQTHDKWDVILFAGNIIPPYKLIDETCIKVEKCQTTTGYLVNGHYITKLMNNIKMGITNLIKNPKNHILYAIDKFWFYLQKIDSWYLIVPLTVIQKEGYSDIEQKNVNYGKIMTDLYKPYLFKHKIKQ